MTKRTGSKREAGAFGEEMATLYLTKLGYSLLCRNYTAKGGEIDIIMTKEGYLCFIEVKLRRKCSGEVAREAVDGEKLSNIKKAINCFFEEYRDNIYISSLTPRIDVIEIYTARGRSPEFNHIIGISE